MLSTKNLHVITINGCDILLRTGICQVKCNIAQSFRAISCAVTCKFIVQIENNSFFDICRWLENIRDGRISQYLYGKCKNNIQCS